MASAVKDLSGAISGYFTAITPKASAAADAAAAPAPAPAPAPAAAAAAAPVSQTITAEEGERKLARLLAMKDRGILSDEVYNTMQVKILEKMF